MEPESVDGSHQISKPDSIAENALKLPRSERAYIAEILIESLEIEDDFDVSDEWMEEIRKRCRQIDEGKARLIPAEEVFARLRREAS